MTGEREGECEGAEFVPPDEAAEEAPEVVVAGAVGGIVVVCPPMSFAGEYAVNAAICAAMFRSMVVVVLEERARCSTPPYGLGLCIHHTLFGGAQSSPLDHQHTTTLTELGLPIHARYSVLP
jgi:hypothetical protein